MKKKIKDLTLEEAKTICNKHSCKHCPLDIRNSSTCHCLELLKGSRLRVKEEREVEIDESNFN